VNSTRSAILTSLNNYRGIVIFASNFTENYDNAINSRIIKIKITNSPLVRYGIWYDQLEKLENNLCTLPAEEETIHKKMLEERGCQNLRERYAWILSYEYEYLVGRDIRKIVEDVLVMAAMKDINNISIKYEYFDDVCKKYAPINEIKTQLTKMIAPLISVAQLGKEAIKDLKKTIIKNKELTKSLKQAKIMSDNNEISDETITKIINNNGEISDEMIKQISESNEEKNNERSN